MPEPEVSDDQVNPYAPPGALPPPAEAERPVTHTDWWSIFGVLVVTLPALYGLLQILRVIFSL